MLVQVDGPYGSGSDRTDEYSTVMLVGCIPNRHGFIVTRGICVGSTHLTRPWLPQVGTGIGVTPFASVMKSLKIRQKREGNSVRPTKVYFYWVCRDQREFDWFSWLIEELSHLGDRFELNTYLTGELNLDEMMKQHGNQPNGLQADEKKAILAGAKGNRSLVNRGRNKVGTDEAEMVEAVGADNETGTKWAGRKWAGRPDWRRIFKEQAAKHAGEEIGVFLCGPGAEELSAMCKKSTTADTAFVFHKEVF